MDGLVFPQSSIIPSNLGQISGTVLKSACSQLSKTVKTLEVEVEAEKIEIKNTSC